MVSPCPQAEQFWRRAVRSAIGFTLASAGVLCFCFPAGKPLALGLLLGGAIGIYRYRLRYRALVRLREAGAHTLVRSRLIGYVLNALGLAAAFLFSQTVSPWTTIAGLFVMNASLIATELLSRDTALSAQKPGIAEKCR